MSLMIKDSRVNLSPLRMMIQQLKRIIDWIFMEEFGGSDARIKA